MLFDFIGNVASKEDRISIAFVVANKGTAEPFLTLHYDEWICVKKGKILFENDGGNVTAAAGDTVFIKVGVLSNTYILLKNGKVFSLGIQNLRVTYSTVNFYCVLEFHS